MSDLTHSNASLLHRCEYGFYGNPMTENGTCLPCGCNEFGSQSNQCDPASGQCFCVAGVTGRDCSQCRPKHVLTAAKTCKNCDHFCTGTLMNELHFMERYLNESRLSGLHPSPSSTLTDFAERTTGFERVIVNNVGYFQDADALDGKVDLLKPQAELVLLETQKNKAILDDLVTELPSFSADVRHVQEMVSALRIEAEGTS